MSAEPKVNIERFLSDLGKATKRGVRKCPQCGTLNGTRGVSCKNGACNYVFKEVVVERRKFSNFDSCKLVTDDPAFDVFSVRIRERGGADDRAFVRVEPKDAVFEEVGPDSGHIARSSIRVTCFVDSCNKKSITIVVVPSASGWKHLPERDDTPCDHAISCLQAKKEAMPFPLKQSVLNSMPISSDWKQKIWLKARNDGPLVQRVSNTAMAVKCDLDLDQNPLGCLHTYFFSGSNSSSSKSSPEVARFVCSCQPRLDIDKSPSRKRILNCNSAIANSAVRCIHFCSCVAVFSGDQNLSKEFAKFLIDDKPILSKYQPEVMEIYGQDEEGRPIRVEVLDEALLSDNFQIEDNSSTSRTTLPTLPEDLEFQFEMEGADGTIQTISVDASEELIPLYDPDFERVTRRDDFASKESSPSTYLSSLQWVGSVAEHINLSMNYQFNGDPDPLVFVVPQCFFDVLRERLSFGKTKKRLPNSTISYQRTETSPIGTYTKYIWKLVNIFQVKNLFENPFVQLDVCRKFVLSKDNSFSYSPMDVSKPSSSPVYKTYLKVGQMTPDTSSVTPFIIEWTPDLLPKTKFGELRIIFKFGHMRDGQVDISRSSNKSGLF